MERVWNLAEFYRQVKVATIAGGWHAHYLPEETLNHHIDVVVHGEAEIVIKQILVSISENRPFDHIPGISYRKDNEIKRNLPNRLETLDLDDLPYPDFGLVKYAKIKIYPINLMRGCGQGCEFCCVRGKPRWSNPQHFFEIVDWLVKTRRAKKFFIIDDRFEEDKKRAIEFFRLVKTRYGNRLHFLVQIRLDAAEDIEFVKEMAEAGVKIVYVGFESPIDEDLTAMNKGYTSAKMFEWAKILTKYFWVHEMFMFGYPPKQNERTFSAQEMERRFRVFIRKTNPFSVQVLKTTPCPGTPLWRRLEKAGRIFPLEIVPWSRYDGNHVCFKPDNMSVRELQEIPKKLMSRFYNLWGLIRIPLRIIPGGIYLIRGWKYWYRGWRRDVIKYGGHRLLQQWQKKQKGSEFIKELEGYQPK